WVDEPVDSSKFEVASGHENTALVQIEDLTLTAPNVAFGAYRIPEFMKSSIGKDESVELSMPRDKLDAISSQTSVSGGTIYIGASASSPNVGDARITYAQRKGGEISLIAVVKGDTFTEFTSSNGGGFWLVANGVSTSEAMLESAEKGNSVMTWILRAIGMILVIIGIGLIFAPLGTIAKVVPFIGNIVGAGTGLIAFLLGFAWSFIVAAIAWVRYRPLLGIALLAAAAVLIVLLSVRGSRRKKRLASASPLRQTVGQRFCPNCGAAQNPNTKFCANCGAEIN
ncbi:MAG: zinc-ribbon domain-containing protein, partial [Oscillospiraceae bacterium]|nr:zinc-ribbon domain-containing protein [Oscillospiraceae bacterium]